MKHLTVLISFFVLLLGCSHPIQERQEIVKALPVKSFKHKALPVGWKPYKTELIIIDPGHGGEDYGTNSKTKPLYHEKSLTLSTARMLKNYLQQLGFQSVMTRQEDLFISLDNRVAFAEKHKGSLYVSVHFNSAPSTAAEGIEVFYYESDGNKKRTAESKKLAHSILTRIVHSSQAKSRGVKHGNFAVIRETTMPAVLVEAGFLTNAGEMDKIKDPAYMKKLAWGIAKGIDEYLSHGTLVAKGSTRK